MCVSVGGLLKQGDQREKNDDRTRVRDLALDVPAIGFVGAHARGRGSYASSLARRRDAPPESAAEGAPDCNGGQEIAADNSVARTCERNGSPGKDRQRWKAGRRQSPVGGIGVRNGVANGGPGRGFSQAHGPAVGLDAELRPHGGEI